MGDDDAALLERWAAGDVKASDELIARYFDALYRFFEHKVDGEVDDLVQETLLGCVRGRTRFRASSSFRTYVFAIARNTLYDHWKARTAAARGEDVTLLSLASLSTSAGSRMARRQEEAQLVEALRQLPLDQQLLLELHYWEDFDAEQLAEIFGTETATSRSRLFRARAALRERLQSWVDEAAVEDDLRNARPPVGTTGS